MESEKIQTLLREKEILVENQKRLEKEREKEETPITPAKPVEPEINKEVDKPTDIKQDIEVTEEIYL